VKGGEYHGINVSDDRRGNRRGERDFLLRVQVA